MLNFKFVALIFSLFLSSSLVSGEIERLSLDSCWVEHDETNALKIASFNEGRTFIVTPSLFQSLMNKVEEQSFKELGLQLGIDSDVEKFIHCGDYGVKVVLNIPQDGFGLCVWATPVDDVSIKVDRIGLIDDEAGSCFGFVPGAMIGKIHEGVPNDFLDRLKAELPAIDSASFIISGMRLIKLSLKKEYYLNVNDIVGDLKELSEIESMEKESFTSGVGEFYKLKR